MRAAVIAAAAVLAASSGACTHDTAPKARFAGEVLSVGGVIGLMGGALAQGKLGDNVGTVMGGLSIVSALGIALYIAGEQTDPGRVVEESPEHMHRRWAQILTERASGAAREGNCKRVARLEKRVNVYNHEVHDFVFMRDPEIVHCLEAPPAAEAPPPELNVDLPPPAPPTARPPTSVLPALPPILR